MEDLEKVSLSNALEVVQIKNEQLRKETVSSVFTITSKRCSLR